MHTDKSILCYGNMIKSLCLYQMQCKYRGARWLNRSAQDVLFGTRIVLIISAMHPRKEMGTSSEFILNSRASQCKMCTYITMDDVSALPISFHSNKKNPKYPAARLSPE